MYPQSALDALNMLKKYPHDYLEFSIIRECYGAEPYLMGRSESGWQILWHPSELED